jgi:hypothetical protein
VSVPETLEPSRFGYAAFRHALVDRDIPGPLTAFLLLPNFNNIGQTIANLPANASSAGHDLDIHPQLHNQQSIAGLHLEAGFDSH